MAKTKVILADDHSILRTEIKHLLSSQQDLEIVAETESGNAAIAASAQFKPDIMVLDISMPHGMGIITIEKVKQASPRTQIIVTNVNSNIDWVKSSIVAGATGYVVKKYAETDLLNAIRSVRNGFPFVKTWDLQEEMVASDDDTVEKIKLSERENEVLKHIAYGYTYDEIAKKLFLSVKSIETYRSRISKKLNLDTRAKLVRHALENGLILPGRYV
jgi:two-component system response regulator NreC